MMKKIILHGHLKDKYPHEISVEADSVSEALHALKQIKELAPEHGQPWPVTVDGVENEIALFSQTKMDEIHVRPMQGGGKKGGLFQVLLGVVMVAVAIIQPQFLAGAISFLGGPEALFLAGGLMIAGGVLQMLMPTPQGYEESESSKYLGANQNTVAIGTRITLAYGNNKLSGHYLSFDVDAIDWAGEDTYEGSSDKSSSTMISTNGTSVEVGEGVYVEYDKSPIDIVPVNPVFSSPTAAPDNIPVSAWSDLT